MKKPNIIYVMNLPWTANKEVITKHFSQFGKVDHISHQRIKETGFYQQYCFVKMATREGFNKVLSCDKHVIDHMKLIVDADKKKTELMESDHS